MLDIHAVTGSGSTALAALSSIAGNDGAVTAGVPPSPQATLVGWGVATINATDAVKQWKLSSLDQVDQLNASNVTLAGTSVIISTPFMRQIMPFRAGARNISAAQAAAGLVVGYTVDHYNTSGTIAGAYESAATQTYTQTFGSAVTAQSWTTQAFSPTNPLAVGTYAILGFWVNNLTNVALIRFQHQSFQNYYPGIAAADLTTGSATPANVMHDQIQTVYQGYQFVRLGEITGKPQCPVFATTSAGSGLNIQCLDNTADTPTVILNIARLS